MAARSKSPVPRGDVPHCSRILQALPTHRGCKLYNKRPRRDPPRSCGSRGSRTGPGTLVETNTVPGTLCRLPDPTGGMQYCYSREGSRPTGEVIATPKTSSQKANPGSPKVVKGFAIPVRPPVCITPHVRARHIPGVGPGLPGNKLESRCENPHTTSNPD
jgi:hypothetical protein